MIPKNDAAEIISRFNAGTATDEEKELIRQWLMFGDFPELLVTSTELTADLLDIDKRLPLRYASATQPGRVHKLWRAVAVAASLILLSTVAFYFYQRNEKPSASSSIYSNDVAPGTNAATLTLADGRTLNLSEAAQGELAQQEGVRITKSADGQLRYVFSHNEKASALYNTLTTPLGGRYEVVLPDGTKAWLNAASSIRFPVSFVGRANRLVEVSGEVYFEVAKVSKQQGTRNKEQGLQTIDGIPFIVKTASQEVEVLGTHFNVNAYGDGGKIRTSLMEGSVRVLSTLGNRKLVPGQQAILSADNLKVVSIDTTEVLAWKNGDFMFNEERLEDILLDVARWYNIEVVYEEEAAKDVLFWGMIRRSAKVSQLLRMLEATDDVRFSVEGRKITVRKFSRK